MPRNQLWRFLCDGSYKRETQKAGIGVIVVNPEDRVVDGVASQVLCRGPIVAEAYAVLSACKQAARRGRNAEVWTDCLQVVKACEDQDDDGPWECSAIIAEIKVLLRNYPLIQIRKCRREAISLADNVARKARDLMLEPQWLQDLLGCHFSGV
ncbi:hypothetical protein LINPERHAP1_LOCUS3828 [Linum perenne]